MFIVDIDATRTGTLEMLDRLRKTGTLSSVGREA